VNFVTLTGVILLVPAISKAAKEYADQFECVAAAFAAGAISACAFFILLFEATHLIAVDHQEEVEQIWRWGTMILAGATFPALLHLGLELVIGKKTSEEASPEDKANIKPSTSGARIISGILLGDFIHNLCDGFFIGAAFAGCGESFGWTVAWGTVAHEVAQELSDYCVLTGSECRLHPLVALGLNFLSGTGVLLGTIIVLSTEVGDGDIGLMLAFGGGTYLYIAFVECMPKVMSAKVSVPVRALAMFVFMIGVIAIGLVLLDHEHCVPPSADGEAGGHGHGHDH
jgi:zinc transporter ZupT